MKEIEQLEIDYFFKNDRLLNNAFIHKSFSYERQNRIENNERLEFLGDAVLELIVSEYMYDTYPDLSEGEMTKIRASVVCEKSLYRIAKQHKFNEFLVVGKCEGSMGSSKTSLLADSVEAVIGAIYLDGGYAEAQRFILNNLKEEIDNSVNGLGIKDYKTILQEELQKNSVCEISYEIEKESGPEHDKTFYAYVTFNSKILGKGKGKTKKEAEQNCAKEALRKIGNE